jgi:hypothetical protein
MAARRQMKRNTKEKQQAVGFINWRSTGLNPKKGFPLYDNEYTSEEERALLELAKRHGGTISLNAVFTVRVATEKPEIDLDAIELIEPDESKAA